MVDLSSDISDKKYIVLGLTPQGLAILRGLGKSRADVTAFCTSKKNVGYYSRYGKKIIYSSISELKNHISRIVQVSDSKPICYITSGEILASVLREYKEIYAECEVYSGPYSVIEMLAHKDQMYEYAIGKGFNVANYATLDKYSVNELRFPLFLKRNYEISLFFKAVMVRTVEEYMAYYERIPSMSRKDVIAQEFIDIPQTDLINISCQGFWVEGKCAGLFVADQKRRLKKGITSYIEEIESRDIVLRMHGLVDGFMAELNYCGFAEFEFMYDKRNDVLWFVEVNTRTCGLQSSLFHKFSNLTEVILHPHAFQELTPIKKSLHWMNIMRDFKARMEECNWQSSFDLFLSKYDILDIEDPIPFLSQFLKI